MKALFILLNIAWILVLALLFMSGIAAMLSGRGEVRFAAFLVNLMVIMPAVLALAALWGGDRPKLRKAAIWVNAIGLLLGFIVVLMQLDSNDPQRMAQALAPIMLLLLSPLMINLYFVSRRLPVSKNSAAAAARDEPSGE